MILVCALHGLIFVYNFCKAKCKTIIVLNPLLFSAFLPPHVVSREMFITLLLSGITTTSYFLHHHPPLNGSISSASLTLLRDYQGECREEGLGEEEMLWKDSSQIPGFKGKPLEVEINQEVRCQYHQRVSK